MSYIVIQGNPVDGFIFHGDPPFEEATDAVRWAADNIRGDEWVVAPLQDVET